MRHDCARSGRAVEDRCKPGAIWLQVLKNDSRAIFIAASKAQAAAD
jgi:antirestriction protein ArdC